MVYHVAFLLLRFIIDQNGVEKFRVVDSEILMLWLVGLILFPWLVFEDFIHGYILISSTPYPPVPLSVPLPLIFPISFIGCI